jgi:hypothetical protein
MADPSREVNLVSLGSQTQEKTGVPSQREVRKMPSNRANRIVCKADLFYQTRLARLLVFLPHPALLDIKSSRDKNKNVNLYLRQPQLLRKGLLTQGTV